MQGIEITRRQLRNAIHHIAMGRLNVLDKQERQIAEEVKTVFNGYLLGSIGWADFSWKWDINPGPPEKYQEASIRKMGINQWGGEIINLWEWKQWTQDFINLFGRNAVPPPCFTQQEKLDNGGKDNI